MRITHFDVPMFRVSNLDRKVCLTRSHYCVVVDAFPKHSVTSIGLGRRQSFEFSG